MAYVIAIPVSDKTVAHSEAFIEAQKAGDNSAAQELISRVDSTTEDMLQLFLVQPTEMVTLSSGQQKIIDFAVNTAGKASHMLTRQIFKKATPAELAPLAELASKQLWLAEEKNENSTRLVEDVDASLVEDFNKARELAHAGKAQENIAFLTNVMDQLNEEIITNFFVEPTTKVKIGFVTQKALNAGIAGSRKAIQAVTGKVLRDLPDDSLAAFLDHFGQVLLEK